MDFVAGRTCAIQSGKRRPSNKQTTPKQRLQSLHKIVCDGLDQVPQCAHCCTAACTFGCWTGAVPCAEQVPGYVPAEFFCFPEVRARFRQDYSRVRSTPSSATMASSKSPRPLCCTAAEQASPSACYAGAGAPAVAGRSDSSVLYCCSAVHHTRASSPSDDTGRYSSA